MNCHLISDFDCFVKVENEETKLLAGIKKSFVVSSEVTFFQAFPLCNAHTNLPICFEMRATEDTVDNGFVETYKLDSENYLCLIHSNYVYKCETLANLSTLSNDYEISQQEKLIISCAGENIICKDLTCKRANLYEKNNLIFCELYCVDRTHLVVLDNGNKILVDDDITLLEHTTNGFQTMLDLKDMQKHGLVKKYTLSDDEFVLSSEYPVYLNHMPKLLSSNKLIPFAFFEAIKAQNISLARNYLENTLSGAITKEHTKLFFGKFDRIYDLSDVYNCPTFCLVSSDEKTANCYRLTLSNNLITNIEKK